MKKRISPALSLLAVAALALTIGHGPGTHAESGDNDSGLGPPAPGTRPAEDAPAPPAGTDAPAATDADEDSALAQEVAAELRALADKVHPAFVMIGQGSAVCISPDGYVLSNHHVAPAATRRYEPDGSPVKWDVRMPGNPKALTARPVGADPRGDIVLLKLDLAEGETVPYVPLSDGSATAVGDSVMVVGDPFLLSGDAREPSLSQGVVTALGRYQGGYNHAMQVDAPVNPGNSGGPVIALDGTLVGIIGRINTRHGSRYNTGAGYAIPACQLTHFVAAMKEQPGGALLVRHGLVAGLAMRHDLRTEGCEVLTVRSGSTASRAGFRAGDLVTAVQGHAVVGATGFYSIVQKWPLNSELTFTVQRGDESVDLTAVLEVPVTHNQGLPWPTPTDSGEERFIFQDAEATPLLARLIDIFPIGRPAASLGLSLDDNNASDPDKRGWTVTRLTSDDRQRPSGATGLLRRGDVVTHLNGRRVRYISDITDILLAKKEGEEVRVTFLRDGDEGEVTVRLGWRRAPRGFSLFG